VTPYLRSIVPNVQRHMSYFASLDTGYTADRRGRQCTCHSCTLRTRSGRPDGSPACTGTCLATSTRAETENKLVKEYKLPLRQLQACMCQHHTQCICCPSTHPVVDTSIMRRIFACHKKGSSLRGETLCSCSFRR
jgi:hypothetical protein